MAIFDLGRGGGAEGDTRSILVRERNHGAELMLAAFAGPGIEDPALAVKFGFGGGEWCFATLGTHRLLEGGVGRAGLFSGCQLHEHLYANGTMSLH